MPISIISLLCAMFSFQTGASVAKHLFPVVGAVGSTSLRLGISAIVALCIWRPWRVSWSTQAKKSVLLYGACMGGMNFLFYLAIERVPLGIGVGLEFVGPLGVALLSSRKPLDFVWALLAAVGIFLLLPISEASRGLDPLGIFYSLAAGVCWGLYIIFGKRAGALAQGGKTLSLGITVAACIALPFGAVPAVESIAAQPSLLIPSFIVAMMSSVIPYSLEMAALRNMAPKTFSIFMSLAPAIASLVGAVVLGEMLNSVQCIAIACVIAASLGSSLMDLKEVANA